MVNKVCIIDDDEISLYLTCLVLEEADFAKEIRSYGSVDDAVKGIPADIANMPQIVLLDLNMPGKNGWDFLELLRKQQDKLLGNMHIFILTSSIAATDKAQAQSYPLVRGFLHKPLNDESIAFIKDICSASP
jgi:CheY-like chemotaxis protein